MSRLVQTFSPLRDVFNLSDEMGRLFWGVSQVSGEGETEQPVAWSPAVDVVEDNDALRIHAELPGLKREDVKIRVHDGVLTLQGERKFSGEQKKNNYYRLERSYGFFARTFTLPKGVDTEKIQAKMKDGVLELTVPKKPEAQAREVNVEIG